MDFHILGVLEVWAEGERITLGGPKQRALLAILLLNANEVLSRDRLIDELWGERAPPSASHTLDAYVSRLRKAIGDREGDRPRLLTRAPGYVLWVAPDELDLLQFERLAADGRRALDAEELELAADKLRAAQRLWRGRPLADLEVGPLTRAGVDRLEELWLSVVEQRVQADLGLGRHRELVAELGNLVREHPLRERLRGQLMLALYRAGRQADALSVYREGHVLLREELGLDPDPQLQELEEAILRQDPAIAASPAGGRSMEAGAPARPASGHPPAGRRRLALAASAVAAAGLLAVGAASQLSGSRDQSGRIEGHSVATVSMRDGSAASAIALNSRPATAAFGGDSVWVTLPDAAAVVRIDHRAGSVRQTVQVGDAPSGVAVGGGSVWVANYLEGTVSRIDPDTQAVVQTIRVGSGPRAVAVGHRVVWVANTLGSSVARIAASTGAVLGSTRVGARPAGIAIGSDGVWVASESQNRVLRLDSTSGSVQRAVAVGTAPSAIASGHGAIWVVNRLDGTVSRIDPLREVVTDTIGVGVEPADIVVGPDAVWVANELDGTLSEIDPRARRVRRTVRLGGRPQSLTASGPQLFVGIAATGAGRRGGTLTLLKQDPEFDSLDPATLLSVSPTQLLGLTNDGLVTLKRAGGAGGVQVVPDLAVSLPTPADGGRTYSFRVRPGIVYSTGRPVQARDFRYTFERLFRIGSPVAQFYNGIAGAARCRRRPRSCDLSRGIVVDEAARRVTFHLRRADPDFLEKLAMPYSYVVPYGSAPREAIRTPLPATGPYMIASYRPGRELTLVRNRRFREWSQAAQPDGHVDEIVWKLGVPLDDALRAIAQGRADWVLNHGPLPGDRRRAILTRHASQAHVNLAPVTHYYFMNTRVPPFDDVRVRRALNYAIDRRALARIYDGRPTCHVVPPQMPGYSPYCPYTQDPAPSGRWKAPDMAGARRLIAESGTAGMKVTVLHDLRTRDLEYIVALLRRLGYRASARIVPGRRYGATISDSRRRVQIGSGGWGADHAAASHFFEAKLSCRVFRPASPFNNNDAEFCDRRIEALADRARRLDTADPEAARRLWERVYREIVDQAPWLPMVTPQSVDFVSKRVGNYQSHPLWGMIVSQLWVTGRATG